MHADDSRLFANALEVSVAALKAEVREQAQNHLLHELHDFLSAMDSKVDPDEDQSSSHFNNGFMACWLEVRTWLVSKGLDLNAGNETT